MKLLMKSEFRYCFEVSTLPNRPGSILQNVSIFLVWPLITIINVGTLRRSHTKLQLSKSIRSFSQSLLNKFWPRSTRVESYSFVCDLPRVSTVLKLNGDTS